MTQAPTARTRKTTDRPRRGSDPGHLAVPRTVRPHRTEVTRVPSLSRRQRSLAVHAGLSGRRRGCRRGVAFYDQEGIRRYEPCGLASEGWSAARAEVALEDFGGFSS